MNMALNNSNTCIGYKLAFYRYMYSIDIYCTINFSIKETDHVGTFMGLKCVVYYANYRSGNQSSKIQVVP